MHSGLEPATDLTFVAVRRRPRGLPAAETGGSRIVDHDPGVIVELGSQWADGDATLLLEGVRRARRHGRALTLVHSGAGGGSFLQAAAAELPALRVREVVHGRHPGKVRAPRWTRRPLESARPEDAAGFAITGGLGGIGMELAAGLADLGRPVWLVDRVPVSALCAVDQHRLAAIAARTRLHVTTADVGTDRLAAPFPISHLVHAAGELGICPVQDLDSDRLERAAAHKADGLRRCVEALESVGLRTVVAFGSVESRRPHPGFSAYALANERLRDEADRIRSAHAHLQIVTAEWSLWSDIGMGGASAGQAAAAGFAVVPPRWGVAATLGLLAAGAPTDIVLGGPQSSASRPVRAVAGVGGSSHRQDRGSIGRLVALCRPGVRVDSPAARPGAVVRAVVEGGRRVNCWTSDATNWRATSVASP